MEVESGGGSRLSPALQNFQEQLGAPHALQLVAKLPFVERDIFERDEPTIVPASTLLSQLV